MNLTPRRIVLSVAPLAILIFILNCGNNPDKAYERAFRAAKQQDWIGASLYAQEFINRFPEDPRLRQVYNLLVNCHLRLGEWSLARSVCQEVMERFPDETTQIGVKLVLGRTYLGERNFNRAMAVFSEIVDSTAGILPRLRAIDDVAFAYEAMAASVGSSTSTDWSRAVLAYNDWLALASSPEAASAVTDMTSARINILQRRAGVWDAAGDYEKAAKAFGEIAAATDFTDLKRAEWSYLRDEFLRDLYQGKKRDVPLTPETRKKLIAAYKDTVQNFPETDYGVWARVELCKLLKPIDSAKAETYLTEAIALYEKHINNPTDAGMVQFYRGKIADAYFRVEALNRAEEAFKNLKKWYGDNQRVVAYANAKMKAIQDARTKAAEKAASATAEIQTTPPTPLAKP